MRNIFKNTQRAFYAAVVAFAGAASLGAPAHAAVDDTLFAWTGAGVGTEQLTINGTTVIQASFTGWNSSIGQTTANTSPLNSDYIVGTCVTCGNVTYNDFFSFSLAGVTGPITSAVLSIYNPGSNNPPAFMNGFNGPDNTFVVHDASAVASDLLAGTNVSTTFNGIANGTVFGNTFVTSAVNGGGNGSQVLVNLNPQAIAALLADEGSTFTVGGTFGAFVSPVPLPAGLPMFVFALLAVFGAVQFSKHRKFA